MSPAEARQMVEARGTVAEDKLSSVEKFGLWVFFISAFIATARVTIGPLVGDWFFALAAMVVPGAAIGVTLSVLEHARRTDVQRAPEGTRIWATVVIVHALLLCALGVAHGYWPRDITRDAVPYIVIAMFALLGHRSSVWEFTEGAALWTCLLAVPVTLYGLDLSDIAGRAAVHSEAYRTQGSFGLWPLLLISLPSQQKTWRRLVQGALPFFVLTEQLLFLKRAPTVRVVLVIVLLMFVAPSIALARRRGGYLLAVGSISLLLGVATITWGEMFSTATASLLNRFEGEGGIGATLVEENGRISEARAWADSTEGLEWVVGRGMGSYFTHADIAEFIHTEVDSQGTLGHRNLHTGVIDPILRGGILFAFVYLGGYLLALSRTRIAIMLARAGEENLRTLGGALFLFVYVTFQFTEGAPTTSWYFDLPVVGLAIGRLLSARMPVAR